MRPCYAAHSSIDEAGANAKAPRDFTLCDIAFRPQGAGRSYQRLVNSRRWVGATLSGVATALMDLIRHILMVRSKP
jgi:hypothetical protein